ncbi:MAG: hypothetical protein UT24_C0015G0036 [Candidatus Woesebacteria bacterium GW2011_GWB1_39_12]|uniref:Uncharacterized protein n=1 Tax=Candidatus Woesebacteria bacterium GW2011_GWB1_39_12 TaxID=1618574 RepID=A0A0G0MAL2_9BACT|nr:MAG: hypothetical protein UT24_C0015G0036 [Candidatus Woesebacteria bacterium GW2011_GWB1_39_12]
MTKIETQEELDFVNQVVCYCIRLFSISRQHELRTDRLYFIWRQLGTFWNGVKGSDLIFCRCPDDQKQHVQHSSTTSVFVAVDGLISSCPWCGRVGTYQGFINDKNHYKGM